MSLAELREVMRRRVAWLRTTTAPLPAYVSVDLADELEQLLDALDRADVDEVREVDRGPCSECSPTPPYEHEAHCLRFGA